MVRLKKIKKNSKISVKGHKAMEDFLIDLKMPSAYSLYKQDKNFIWYQKQIQKDTPI